MKMKKNNIVICGYFGYRNAGDELILRSMVEGLRGEKGINSITVLSSRPHQTRGFYGVKAINRWNPLSIIRAMLSSGTMISAGGLYQDVTGSLSLYYYLALILLAKLCGCRVLLCGVDFGPVNRRFNRFLIRLATRFTDRIAVRSRGSFEFLEKLGLPAGMAGGNIQLTADYILGDTFGIKKRKESIGDLKKIMLILRLPRGKYDVFRITHFCESLSRRLNVGLVFVPFHIEQDMVFLNEVMRNLKVPAKIARWNKPGDLYDILSSGDLIISQRLHGLIIGSALGMPVIGISGDTKLAFFMRELNQERFFFSDFDSDTVIGAIEDLWRWKDEFRTNISKILPRLQYRATLNHNCAKDILQP